MVLVTCVFSASFKAAQVCLLVLLGVRHPAAGSACPFACCGTTLQSSSVEVKTLCALGWHPWARANSQNKSCTDGCMVLAHTVCVQLQVSQLGWLDNCPDGCCEILTSCLCSCQPKCCFQAQVLWEEVWPKAVAQLTILTAAALCACQNSSPDKVWPCTLCTVAAGDVAALHGNCHDCMLQLLEQANLGSGLATWHAFWC